MANKSPEKLSKTFQDELSIHKQENYNIRKKLKELGEKLDIALELKAIRKRNKTGIASSPEKKIEDFQKLMKYYQ